MDLVRGGATELTATTTTTTTRLPTFRSTREELYEQSELGTSEKRTKIPAMWTTAHLGASTSILFYLIQSCILANTK